MRPKSLSNKALPNWYHGTRCISASGHQHLKPSSDRIELSWRRDEEVDTSRGVASVLPGSPRHWEG